MEIKSKICLDLQNMDMPPIIFAKQGDVGSRIVEISLTDNHVLWPIPADSTVVIRYRKSNGAAGMYDTLPDGKSAYTVDASRGAITITLVPQILAEPGRVRCDIGIVLGAKFLATFDFAVQVNRSPVDAADLESQDYYKLASLEQINAAIDHLRVSVSACVRSVNSIQPDVDGNVQIPTGGLVDSVNGKTGTVVLDAASVGAVPASGGTMTGNLNMGGKEISNAKNVIAENFTVQHPTIENAGAWIAAENPVLDASGTPVKQVLAVYGSFGDEGTILRNIAAPEQDADAANKGYVDKVAAEISKEPGPAGEPGKDGADGAPGKDGEDGKSAYQLAVEQGFAGTLQEWLESLKGEPGKDGAPGKDGIFTGIPDGYCQTAGDTATKVEQGFITDEITDGTLVAIYFQNANTAANPTLKAGDKSGSILGADGMPETYPGIASGTHLFIWFDRYSGWWLVNPQYNGLPIVESSESYVNMEPGKYYNLTGSGDSLTITLSDGQKGRAGLYCGCFYSGAAPKNLTVPAGIRWVGGVSIESNKKYQFSILNEVGVMAGV